MNYLSVGRSAGCKKKWGKKRVKKKSAGRTQMTIQKRAAKIGGGGKERRGLKKKKKGRVKRKKRVFHRRLKQSEWARERGKKSFSFGCCAMCARGWLTMASFGVARATRGRCENFLCLVLEVFHLPCTIMSSISHSFSVMLPWLYATYVHIHV